MEKVCVYRPRSLAYLLCVILPVLFIAAASYLLYLGITEADALYIAASAVVILVSLRCFFVLLSYNLKVSDTYIAAYRKRATSAEGIVLSPRKTRAISEKILFKEVKGFELKIIGQKARAGVYFIFYFENQKPKKIDTRFYGKKQTLQLKDLIENRLRASRTF